MSRTVFKEKMALARKGEVVVFEARYGKHKENLLLKVYCADRAKLLRWAQERRLLADIVEPVAGVPHLVCVKKQKRRVPERAPARAGAFCKDARKRGVSGV